MAAGQVWLAGEDAAELAQMLEFVDDWLGGPDRQLLTDSLARFVGAGVMTWRRWVDWRGLCFCSSAKTASGCLVARMVSR
jgi:hypothetical protein